MKSEALFPNHKNMDLPFVIHAVGAAQKQARRKRDEGAVNTQVIYGAQGEGRLTVVDVIGKEAVEQSQKLADSIGIPLRVRVYEE